MKKVWILAPKLKCEFLARKFKDPKYHFFPKNFKLKHIFFQQLFSWNQSCQQLKIPKPQHFHEFFTQKIDNFHWISKLNFWTKNEDFEQCVLLTPWSMTHDWVVSSQLLFTTNRLPIRPLFFRSSTFSKKLSKIFWWIRSKANEISLPPHSWFPSVSHFISRSIISSLFEDVDSIFIALSNWVIVNVKVY